MVSQDQLPAKSYRPAKFGAYKHCGSKRMVILVWHVILHDHVIKESYITLWEGAHHGKLPSHQVWWQYALW